MSEIARELNKNTLHKMGIEEFERTCPFTGFSIQYSSVLCWGGEEGRKGVACAQHSTVAQNNCEPEGM